MSLSITQLPGGAVHACAVSPPKAERTNILKFASEPFGFHHQLIQLGRLCVRLEQNVSQGELGDFFHHSETDMET